jgi:hypothetical protein
MEHFPGSLYKSGGVVTLGYRGHYQWAFRGLLLALAREAPALLHTQQCGHCLWKEFQCGKSEVYIWPDRPSTSSLFTESSPV